MKYKTIDNPNQPQPLLEVPRGSQQSEPVKTGPLPTAVSPIIRLFDVSGLYSWKSITPNAVPDTAVPTPARDLSFTWGIGYEALRLDVDGQHPQMVASGTIKNLFHTVHWLAPVEAIHDDTWLGNITSITATRATFPYTAVQITAVRSMFSNQRQLNVTLMGDGVAERHNTLQFESPAFQKISLAFDFATAKSAAAVRATAQTPTRQVSLTDLFQQVGFDVTITARTMISEATPDPYWREQELHDAMQFYWANSENVAEPTLWAFFAPLHQDGKELGSTIYDDIGPTHGQGTAVFTDSFIAQSPASSSLSTNWPQFGLTCRQIAAALHPLTSQTYPHGTQIAYITDPSNYLTDCFNPAILTDLRHTTTQHKMNKTADWANWDDEQGFSIMPHPSLRLELCVNRDQASYEFMEPVILELKLTNIDAQAQWTDKTSLTNFDNLTLIIKQEGKPAQQFWPYKRDYRMPQPQQLMPGQSLHASLFIAAGRQGWYIAEPGRYSLQVRLTTASDGIITSDRLQIVVRPPTSFVQEYLAQDFFADDVGRILAFNGSRFLNSGNQVLREVMARLPLKPVALHAAYALGLALAHEHKRLVLAGNQKSPLLRILRQPGREEEARLLLNFALVDQADTAVTTFGHIRWQHDMEQFSIWLTQRGDNRLAAKTRRLLEQTKPHLAF